MRLGSSYLLATFQARGVGAASSCHKLRSLLGNWGIVQNSRFLTQMISHIMWQHVPWNCDMHSAIRGFLF